jgi:mannosyl-oligosaccharide alpha-1,2-mannosidase
MSGAGGKMADNQTIVDVGLALNDGCWNTYASTATGIGPEAFAFASADGDYTGGGTPNAAQQAFFAQHGFYVTDADYIQRPEVLESNFYAWRATGDQKYLARAASAIDSFNTYLSVAGGAYAAINDVTVTNPAFIDDTESFWFAEVLKYL